MMDYLDLYKDVIALNFEFVAADGERQRPICLVARSLKKGTQTRLWVAEGAQCPSHLGQNIYTLAITLRLNGTAS